MDNSFEENVEQIAAKVLSNSRLSEVRLSPLTVRLFAEAARLLRFKRSEQNQLSSTTYTLAAYLYARSLPDDTVSTEERELQDAIREGGLSSGILNEIAGSFFSSIPEVPRNPSEYPSSSDLSGVVLGVRTSAVIADWRKAEPLHADVLLKILLDNANDGVFRRVRARFDEEQGRSVERPPGAAPQEVAAP